MLVLSRHKDETIVIPGIGEIKVVEIRGKKVRLGLDFLPDIKIYRGEIAPTEFEPVTDADPVSSDAI